MHRAVKLGLYGTVLAGLVGGTIAWAAVDKTVHVQVDGQAKTVHTVSGTVAGALRDGGLAVGAHDFVAPAADASVHDGSQVVLRRGRQLMLDVDGRRQEVWTTADTVDSALADLGYTTRDYSSVSRSQRLPLTLTDITLRTPKLVAVVHDGRTEAVMTTDATVGQVLADLGVTVGPADRLVPAAGTAVTSGLRITVGRITSKQVTQQQQVPFPTTRQNAPSLPTGQTQVVTPGKDGVLQVTYQIVYLDGKPIGQTTVARTTLSAPQPQVLGVGTGPAATTPAATGSASAAGAATPAVTPGSAQAVAQSMLASFGWSSDQMSCLIQMWDHESGWRTDAANPSGAYGIPQALPGSKMAAYGPDWQTNPRTQITWGLNYIKSRYNSPCRAWSTWQANGGWY